MFYQSGSKSSLLPDIETPCKKNQLWGSLKKKKKKKKLVYFLKESLGNLHALEGLASMSNFFHLLSSNLSPQHTRTCFSLSLNLHLCKTWEFPRGLFICPENFHFQKIFPSPGGWLSLTPTTATSPFASVYSSPSALSHHLCGFIWPMLHLCVEDTQRLPLPESRTNLVLMEAPRESQRDKIPEAVTDTSVSPLKTSLGSGPGAPRPLSPPNTSEPSCNLPKSLFFFCFQ